MRQGTIVKQRHNGYPLSLLEAKQQLRIDAEDTDQDQHITTLCAAAHRHIERELGYPILQQTRETHLSCFPSGPIWLGSGANLSLIELRYVDRAGAVQVMPENDYALDAVSPIAKVWPTARTAWPSTMARPGAVVIEWQAGWETPVDVPEDLRHAMKLLVGHWDQNREAVIVGSINSDLKIAVEALLAPFRVPFVA